MQGRLDPEARFTCRNPSLAGMAWESFWIESLSVCCTRRGGAGGAAAGVAGVRPPLGHHAAAAAGLTAAPLHSWTRERERRLQHAAAAAGLTAPPRCCTAGQWNRVQTADDSRLKFSRDIWVFDSAACGAASVTRCRRWPWCQQSSMRSVVGLHAVGLHHSMPPCTL